MYIYSIDNGVTINRFTSKAARNKAAQEEVNKRFPKEKEVLVHLGVCRDGDDELCEGKRLTSRRT